LGFDKRKISWYKIIKDRVADALGVTPSIIEGEEPTQLGFSPVSGTPIVIFGQYPRLQSGVKNEKRIPKEDTPLVATGGLKPPVAKPRFTFS
jgi:hypothetical protein